MKVRQNITIINDKEKQDMNEPKIRFQGFEGNGKVEEVTALQGVYAFQSSSFCKDGVPIVRIANILHSGEMGGKPYK